MASEGSALFSREDVLSGRSARRSTTILFAIENRTAHLLASAQQAVPVVLSEGAVREREHAFLEALGQGRDLPLQPTIQDLERHAPEWADLVPDDPRMRAGLARLVGAKYVVPRRSVPRLRSALGLDTDPVQDAYRSLFDGSLDTIYAPQIRLADRVRWTAAGAGARLDALPAFWLAFVVTLIIGAVNLALPIAVSGVGALPGVALIVVLGLINMVTIAAMVETVTRSGGIRFGNAFIGTVVTDYLGGAASAILSLILVAFSFGLLLILYIGISTTLADATALPAAAWMIVLFLIGLYFLTRGSLNATVASTIVITTINVVLIVVLSVLALAHLEVENLTYVNLPWSDGGTFTPILLGALIGVVLDLYAAHILVAIFGRTLLERDPSGRSVVRGHVAGIGFAMVLNVLWVLAVCGAIAPDVLASETSTALVPLAEEIGPQVQVLGAIFVVLSMGLGLIQFSLALFNLARERIGRHSVPGGSRGRFLLSLTPVVVVVLVAEWMVLTGTGSFAGILGFLGVMVHSLMSGIFPVLLLAASRRKGEIVPGVSYRALGHPLVIGGVYFVFLANLLLHGLVIWEEAFMRAGGVLMSVLIVGVTMAMARRGAFATRAVVELRQDRRRGRESLVAVVTGGEPASAEMRLTDAGGERTTSGSTLALPDAGPAGPVGVDLLSARATELKVWAHAISPEGLSQSLPAVVTVRDGDETREVDLGRSDGEVVLPLRNDRVRVELTLPVSG